MPINNLVNKCDNVKKAIVTLNKEYATQFDSLPKIKKQLKKVVNRSSEYANGSFIVLVVGPVKSGKSTLVNLIADAYVSPTNFLECTVRPSIISKQKDGKENQITSFSSSDTENKVEHIDSIIDCIRGMESEDLLPEMNIDIDRVALTADNIKEKVELGLQDSLTAETLVTSITTPGGQLLQDNVFVMDMPGFDGKYANMYDSVYETIAQRADLIIFVQSSNSAISKVSKDFLEVLKENNKNVPVCLVHNFFEAAYWHGEKEKLENNDEQKKFAIREIRELGFNIDEEHCFCINLGKVKDAREKNEDGEYLYSNVREQLLKPEEDRYIEMEQLLYERVVNHRDEMQLQNSLNRTNQQLEKLKKMLEDEVELRKGKIAKYIEIEKKIENLDISEAFGVSFSFPVNVRPFVDAAVINAVSTKINDINNKSRFYRSEAQKKVRELISYCGLVVHDTYVDNINVNVVEDSLYTNYLERKNKILELGGDYKVIGHVEGLNKLQISELPHISLESCVDVTTVVPSILIGTDRDYHLKRHKKEHISVYFNTVKTRLIGTTHPIVVNSYIQQSVEPVVTGHINENINNIEKDYLSNLKSIKEDYKEQVLRQIIPDKYDSYVQSMNGLDELLMEVKRIINSINPEQEDEA